MRTLSRRQFLALPAGAALAAWLDRGRLPARAQGLVSLSVGLGFVNLDVAPAWIAQDRHLFEKYGLNVTIVTFQGGARSATAMAAGDVPLSLIGAADMMNATVRGFPLKMIAGLTTKFAYDLVVAKNISSPGQLRGTRGAISSYGSTSEFAARYALSRLGIGPNEVTLLQVGDESARLAALQSGQMQFTVLTAGLDLAAFDLGFKSLLKMYTLDQPFQSSGIAVNTIWARTHRGVVDSFLKAIITAYVYIKNPLNVAAALALLHPHLSIKDEHLQQGFHLYRDRFYETYPFVSVPGVEFIMRERKITQPATDFYDNSYVQALRSANFAAAAAKVL